MYFAGVVVGIASNTLRPNERERKTKREIESSSTWLLEKKKSAGNSTRSPNFEGRTREKKEKLTKYAGNKV